MDRWDVRNKGISGSGPSYPTGRVAGGIRRQILKKVNPIRRTSERLFGRRARSFAEGVFPERGMHSARIVFPRRQDVDHAKMLAAFEELSDLAAKILDLEGGAFVARTDDFDERNGWIVADVANRDPIFHFCIDRLLRFRCGSRLGRVRRQCDVPQISNRRRVSWIHCGSLLQRQRIGMRPTACSASAKNVFGNSPPFNASLRGAIQDT